MAALRDRSHIVDESRIKPAYDFITGSNTREQITAKLISRYAMQIVSASKDDKNTYSDQTYAGDQMYLPSGIARGLVSRPDEVTKYAAGLHPVINSGICQDILTKTAVMFKSKEQRFNFMRGEASAKDAEAFLDLHRQYGAFADTLVQADYLACGINASLVHVYPKGDWLAYAAICPSCIRVVFGSTIKENTAFSGLVENSVDYCDIEDASAVILDMGSSGNTSNDQEHLYLAYIAASEDLPNGRKVTFTSNDFWPVPDIGDASIVVENKYLGVPANPMTVIAKSKSGIGGGYEYPFAVLKGAARYGENMLLPTSSEFYLNCLDIETELSAIFGNCTRTARGIHVINLTNAATRLPSSLDVPVMTDGATFNFLAGNSSGLEAGMENALKIMRGVAASRGVPAYMMIGPLQGSDASGVALYIQTQPLMDTRETAIEMNKGQIDKLPYIETALLASMNQATVSLFKGVTFNWNPGLLSVPEEPLVKITRLVSARDAGAIDHLELVRSANDLATIQESEDLIEVMKERDPDYETKKEEPVMPGEEEGEDKKVDQSFGKTGQAKKPDDSKSE